MAEPDPPRLADGLRRGGFLRAEDFAGSPERPLLRAGERFGERFEVHEELGRGGMGVVHRARDLRSGETVALKVLAAGPRQAERWARFEREGQVAASLRHPGIVRLLSSGEVAGTPFLAYELVPDHRTLVEAFERREARARAALVLEAARALAHAHAHGVVHRDVKPANLLVDGAGRVRVTDFGLALVTGSERLTATGYATGTPAYMAPERWGTDREAVGPWTDVWSLGAVLYLALTLRRPFGATNPAALLAQVTGPPPPAPRTLAPDVPAALEAVCLRALRRDPRERHPDAGAFAGDLALALRT